MTSMTQKRLIKKLVKEKYLKTPLIIEAFQQIDRQDFVLEKQKEYAYVNQAMPIGENQTISQPLTVAFMLEKLNPKPGEKILDIGSGSGWQAALLSYIVSKNDNKEGKVFSIERIPELKKMAKTNLKKYDFIKKEITQVIKGNGINGYISQAPYDKIIAAAAGNKIPQAWKKQLKTGGKIVAPVKSSIYVLDKTSNEDFEEKQYFGFSFVPLINKKNEK